jgi:catechol 2,3-dioxygenase-like lactoylglutathione lyase family enzyme
MNWTLEVVVVPVRDIERAKAFYAEQLGFVVDHDTEMGPEVRIVQLTPPGSGCSVVIGRGAVPEMPPGSLRGLQLVVNDLRAAHAQLVERGVEVTPIQFYAPEGPRAATDADDLNNSGFCFFNDPDGNGWAVQQITARP